MNDTDKISLFILPLKLHCIDQMQHCGRDHYDILVYKYMKAHGLKYFYAYLPRVKLKMKFICPLLKQLVKQPTLYYFVKKRRSLMYRLQSR